MPHKPDRKCNLCGKIGWSGTTSLPEGQYRCRECRRGQRQPYGPRESQAPRRRTKHHDIPTHALCPECGKRFKVRINGEGYIQRFCSQSCAQTNRFRNPANRVSTRAVPNEWTVRTRRRYRERVTPGLTVRELRELRDRWTGSPCAYCSAPSTTIDHVLPISRGGTNYIGNLVPCCKPCNSSKCDLTLTEWRYGKPHAGTLTTRPWMAEGWDEQAPRPARRDTRPELSLILDSTCVVCGHTFTPLSARHVTCGSVCSDEYAKRCARNAYRRKVGKAEDWTTPVKRRSAA
jgi:hypothetical protein